MQAKKPRVSVCEEPRQRSVKWCRVTQRGITHPQKTRAKIETRKVRSTNNAKQEIWNTGLSLHRHTCACTHSNRPAGRTESGGSSNWCQMLFTRYFQIKWHLRGQSSRVNTHQRDIWSNWKQGHWECSRRPRCFILGCRRCGSAAKNSFFPLLSFGTTAFLRSNRCFQPTLLLLSH